MHRQEIKFLRSNASTSLVLWRKVESRFFNHTMEISRKK